MSDRDPRRGDETRPTRLTDPRDPGVRQGGEPPARPPREPWPQDTGTRRDDRSGDQKRQGAG